MASIFYFKNWLHLDHDRRIWGEVAKRCHIPPKGLKNKITQLHFRLSEQHNELKTLFFKTNVTIRKSFGGIFLSCLPRIHPPV